MMDDRTTEFQFLSAKGAAAGFAERVDAQLEEAVSGEFGAERGTLQ